ncbi:hypothetical protein FHU38_001662 [Saccharomonospora amisosensis]|uniref:Uncharacterized protein n=1 Tax=Saccharomonospora amisosensis TaxID=1128677 RepID=A0A7X5ZQ06_9PSEU|nr:hypothetical protein [Saccharomonospora amisosensis]NIJ11318.1 hypothetical protein [Saccharomonospora amisosensis]
MPATGTRRAPEATTAPRTGIARFRFARIWESRPPTFDDRAHARTAVPAPNGRPHFAVFGVACETGCVHTEEIYPRRLPVAAPFPSAGKRARAASLREDWGSADELGQSGAAARPGRHAAADGDPFRAVETVAARPVAGTAPSHAFSNAASLHRVRQPTDT